MTSRKGLFLASLLLESIAINVSHVPDGITIGPHFCLIADVASWSIPHDVRPKEDKDSPFEDQGGIIFCSMFLTALIVLFCFIALVCSSGPRYRARRPSRLLP
jgi:hypothetical protein